MEVFLLLSLLLDYYYYHYNILLRFLYFGEEEMATQQPPGVEAAKTASVFDVLLLRRFLFSAFGRRWPRAHFLLRKLLSHTTPTISRGCLGKKWTCVVMRYLCANFLIYCMTRSFRFLLCGSLRTFVALSCLE